MNDEKWLEKVAAELRTPVPVAAGFEQRVVAAVARSARRRRLAAWGVVAAGFAAAAVGALRWSGRGGVEPRGQAVAGTEVEFAIELPAATAVTVVGDFNDWDRARTPLVRSEDGSRWSARLQLTGGVYHYAFLVDGVRWVADPRHPAAVDRDYGHSVSLMAVQ